MGGISAWKLLLILVVILLIFGGRRIPELGKSLGAGIANFRKSFKEEDCESDKKTEDEADKKIGAGKEG